MLIMWTAPYDSGAEITSYTITIKQKDGTFSEEPISCDGSDPVIMFSLSCNVPGATLRAAPYSLDYADPIYAKVSATNIKGTSLESDEGNGASIISEPDAPINFVENLD